MINNQMQKKKKKKINGNQELFKTSLFAEL